MTKIYVGDVGTEIILDCGQSIASATTTDIKVTKPNNTTDTWTGSIYNTNYIKYTIQTGDLDVVGPWLLQAYVVTPSGTWRGETAKMEVYQVFE